MLNINTTDAVPIWKQIEDEVRRLIAVGRLEPGGSIPSVRDMAKELRVNPATVARAYQRLTDAGILMVRRGEGTFVSESPTPLRKSERRETLAAAAIKYVSLAITTGASLDEAIEEVRSAFAQLNGGDRRKQ